MTCQSCVLCNIYQQVSAVSKHANSGSGAARTGFPSHLRQPRPRRALRLRPRHASEAEERANELQSLVLTA